MEIRGVSAYEIKRIRSEIKMEKNEIKRTQEINRKILDEVDRICKKYDICYFIDCGALLGAVRHQAFIPWDDDADLSFTRENYEKFVEAVKTEWEQGDFILHKPEDFGKGRWLDYITRIIYKNDTVNVNTYDKVGEEASGEIWGKPAVDVFIIDNAPDSARQHKILCLYLTLYYGLAMGHRKFIDYSEYTAGNKAVIWLLSHIGRFLSVNWIIKKYNKHSTKYRNSSGEYCFYSNYSLQDIRKRSEKKWYQNGTLVNIDESQYNAPVNYDMVLKMNYGDYMKLPPESERIPKHL